MKRFLFIPLFIFATFSFVACDDTVEVCVIDGVCDVDETWAGCPEDCASDCQVDGICDLDWEDAVNCPADCATGSYCGDGVCDADEDDINCAADCYVDPCGDGVCDTDETWLSCAADCASDCNNDGVCDADWEDAVNCPADCDTCNDGVCDADESYYDCPEDCASAVCDDWAVWVETLGCEDDLDTCTVSTTCDSDLLTYADTATMDEADLLEDCAVALALDDGTCTDVVIDTFNCADELIATAGMVCAKK